MATLYDVPDWAYLLREFDHAYRFGSAGGSAKIRSHMKVVRDRIAKNLAAAPEIALPEPAQKPVTAHLRRALDNGSDAAMKSMVRTVENIQDQLAWVYGYEKMPTHLAKKYAYAEILSPRGPIFCDDLVLGLVLFAPKTTYPAHSHKGITESYISISGHWSENNISVFGPGSMAFNPPEHTHTITTADREPVLLGYAWTGAPEELSAAEMKFSRRRKTKK